MGSVGSILGNVGQDVLDIVSRNVGGMISGGVTEFSREVYPHAYSQAAQSGIPVIVFWYGDAIEIDPNGQYMIVNHSGSLQVYQQFLAQLATTRKFYVGVAMDEQNISAGLRFTLQGVGNPVVLSTPGMGYPGTPTAGFGSQVSIGGSGWLLIIAVVVALFFLGKKK